MKTNLANYLYFGASVFLIAWAVKEIWRVSTQRDNRNISHFEKYKRKKSNASATIRNYLWRKHYRLLILIIAASLGVVIILVDNIILMPNIPPESEMSALLLLATAAVVFWYTRETYDLKVIQQDQKKIQQLEFDFENRPYLRLQWSAAGDEVLQIVNDGNGLARNVCFEPMKINTDTPFAPLRRPVIAAGQFSTITIHELQEAAGQKDLDMHGKYKNDIKSLVNELLKAGEFSKIQVTYLDLRDQVYDAFFLPDERYNDRFNIESQEKRG